MDILDIDEQWYVLDHWVQVECASAGKFGWDSRLPLIEGILQKARIDGIDLANHLPSTNSEGAPFQDDSDNARPLVYHCLVGNQSIDCLALLHRYGADLDSEAIKNSSTSLLHSAAMVGNVKVFDYVLNHVNEEVLLRRTKDQGLSVLNMACFNGNAEIALKAIEKAPMLMELRTNSGESAVRYAMNRMDTLGRKSCQELVQSMTALYQAKTAQGRLHDILKEAGVAPRVQPG